MSKKDSKFSGNRKKAEQYLKYSGMVFQLFILLAIAAFIGQKLDQRYNTKSPYFTASLLILFLIAYLFKLYRDLFNSTE